MPTYITKSKTQSTRAHFLFSKPSLKIKGKITNPPIIMAKNK